LTIINTDSYGVEMDLERLLQSSFPNPGDKDKIRRLFIEDVQNNMLGVKSIRRKRDSFHVSYFNNYSTKS
jgi:hypothetical protein